MAIIMPEKKPGLLSKIAGPAGSIIGGAAGFVGSGFNPAGAALGASLGGAAGGAAAGIAEKDTAKVLGGAAQGVAGAAGAASDEAMARRLEKLRSTGATDPGQWKLGEYKF